MAASAPLEERIARYERILSMRAQTPPMTYEAIGEVFRLPKQRIHKIEAGGRPKRTGRPAGPERVARLREKLAFWERQRERIRDDPERVAEAENRIAKISAELAREP
jgi:hypothetical protein